MKLLWWLICILLRRSVSALTSADLDGWKRHGDSFYKAFLTPLEFSDAKASCEDNGGYLANADTPEKNDYIRSLVSSGPMWFGLTLNDSAEAPPFTFYYVSGISLTSYTPWEPNQPNNYRNKQHCVHIENSGLWDDTQCWNSKPYVCEKDASSTPYPCPNGFFVFEGYCYHQSTDILLYWDAVSYCEKLSAPIACYSSSTERQSVLGSFSENFWLGLVDRKPSDGTFGCIDGTTEPYTEWYHDAADCTGSGDVYVYDKRDGMRCMTVTYREKRVMCKKLACPYGWQEYHGNCYQAVTLATSRADADAHCESLGGIVAPPTSDESNKLIAHMTGGSASWIGISTVGGEVMRTDALEYTYTNWQSPESGGSKECVQIQADGTWITADCTGQAPYVCAQVHSVPSYSVMRGYKLQKFILAELEAQTLGECAARCDEQIDPLKGRICYSFSYNPDSKACDLNTNQPSNIIPEEVRVQQMQWNLYVYNEDVCDIPLEDRVPIGFDIVTGVEECLPSGYCLESKTCYYPRNHIYDADDSAEECPEGWTHFDNTCYKMLSSAPTYQDALATCGEEASHLVTVTDLDHMTFIYQQFLKSENKVWLGLRNIADTWSWVDGQESSFRLWKSGEPHTASYSVVRSEADGFWSVTTYSATNNPLCYKPSCPVGWRWMNENCYQMSQDALPHDEADQVCGELGASLAENRNTEEGSVIQIIAGGATIWLGYVNQTASKENKCYVMEPSSLVTSRMCTDNLPFLCVIDQHIPGFRVISGAYIKGHNLASHRDITVQRCAEECRNYQSEVFLTRCVSFDYDTVQSICYLSERNQETILHEVDWRLSQKFLHYERDVDVCGEEGDEMVECPAENYEGCLNKGCCWVDRCYKSKSSEKVPVTCDEGCDDVMNAVRSGDDDVIEDTYYKVGYENMRRMAADELPDEFWTWLNNHDEAKKALLSISWPVDSATLYGFYELWNHVGADRASRYYHLLLATAYNHRAWGLHMNPRFYRKPGYWHYLRSDDTYTGTRDPLSGLSRDQEELIIEGEDLAVAAAAETSRKKRSATSVRECRLTTKDEWYNGHQNMTETGHLCQAWASNYPNDHSNKPETYDPDNFPDATIEDAGNYCRNPDNSKKPWCYIADPDGPKRKYCDIPMCVNTKAACKFPFVSPYTGNVWYRCAIERGYDKDEFCMDHHDRLIECHHDYTDDNVQDDGCVFPFTWQETGETYNSCIGGGNPWCASWQSTVPISSTNDYRRYCLSDYNLTASMYKWTSVLENPIEMRAFTEVRHTFLSKCHNYFTQPEEIPFPPRDHAPNGFEAIDFYLDKYENTETSNFFNYFPTMSAEWPLLLHLNLDIPVQECEWVWKRWMTNEKIILYSHYSKQSLNNLDVICKPSKWTPFGSLIYTKEEGGICGQHSYLYKYTGMCLGMPGNIVSQPAHLALFTILHHPHVTDDVLNGPYFWTGQQFVGNGEYNAKSAGMAESEKHMLTLQGQPESRVVNIDFERGVVHTMNQGYDVFIKGRRALNIFNMADDAGKENMLGYLVGILESSPYQTHIWFEIADFLSGQHWNVGGERLLYPLTCRIFPGLDELRTRLQTLSNQYFLDQRIYLHTHLTAITRILFPASCCNQRPEYKSYITSAYETLDFWNPKYGDHVRMHYLKCEAEEGTFDESASEMLSELLSVSGWSTENQEKERFIMFFDEALTLFLDGTPSAVSNLINFIESMTDEIPHVEVGSTTWALTVQYDHMTKELLLLYDNEGLVAEAEVLAAHKYHLADKSKGDSITYWQDLADDNRLVGSYELILAGIKKWDAEAEQFYIEF